jgi:hypothetical protein
VAYATAHIVAALTGEEQNMSSFILDFEPTPEDVEMADKRSQLERLAIALGAEVRP